MNVLFISNRTPVGLFIEHVSNMIFSDNNITAPLWYLIKLSEALQNLDDTGAQYICIINPPSCNKYYYFIFVYIETFFSLCSWRRKFSWESSISREIMGEIYPR